MAKDNPFVERDDNGKQVARQHDSVPVKQKRRVFKASPRLTERAALDRAAYGEDRGEAETPAERETAIYKTGAFAYCVKCGLRKPATTEYFKVDRSKRRGWKQPCKDCDALLSRRRQWENGRYGHWRRSGKFRKASE